MAEVDIPKLEELEELKGKAFTRRVALTTAVFAVVLALAGLGGNNARKEMLLAQQQASDQWAFYQGKVIREHQYRIQKLRLEGDLAERGPAMKPTVRQKLEALLTQLADEEKRYSAEKKEIEKEAKQLEQKRDHYRARDPYFEYAEVLLQIAIVLSSIAILAGSRPLFFCSFTVALLGTFLAFDGYTLVVTLPVLHSGH